jgi:hypothetical protein
MIEGRRWIEQDRYGNEIYLTEERWEHIVSPTNHPEMSDYENELRETIRTGRRKQEVLNPQKYRYSKEFDNLTAKNTHIVAVIFLRFFEDEKGVLLANNFIVTVYQKKVW